MSKLFDEEKKKIIDTLIREGVPLIQAETVGDCLATADEYGVSSHGIRILDAYVSRIKCGGFNLSPSISVEKELASFAVVNGDNSLGPVSATFCMNYALEKAQDLGIFAVFSHHNNTFGPAFYYPLIASRKDMIGIIFSNSPAQMAPFGGKERLLGTNPFSAVIPVPSEPPIIIDMATSVVAKSRFMEYKEKGLALPLGWALDCDGNPTTDPDKAMAGLVQPMAGFKGYGLAMLIDILSGVISGAGFLNKVGRFYTDDGNGMNVGFCCIAINPAIVLGEDFKSKISEFVHRLRSSPKSGLSPIVLPGDDRHATKRINEEADYNKHP